MEEEDEEESFGSKIWSCGWDENYQLGRVMGASKTAKKGKIVDSLSYSEWKGDVFYYLTNISSGLTHSCGISSDGEIVTWGSGKKGRLGNGSESESLPRCISIDGFNKRVVDVSCGNNHTCAVFSNGDVFSWGGNQFGQLGVGDTDDRVSPCRVVFGSSKKIVGKVSCGAFHTLVSCHDDNSMWSFGRNDHGELGVDPEMCTAVSGDSSSSQCSVAPVQIDPPDDWSGIRPSGISCGAGFSLAAIGGSAWSWGDNSRGQLGIGGGQNIIPNSFVPVRVKIPKGSCIVEVSVGLKHCTAIDIGGGGGRLLAWGDNSHMQLGFGALSQMVDDSNSEILATPRPVKEALFGLRVTKVSCGSYHTACITERTGGKGGLYTWGLGDYGQLGHGSTSNVSAPRRVKFPIEIEETKLTILSCGGRTLFFGTSPPPAIQVPLSEYRSDFSALFSSLSNSEGALFRTDVILEMPSQTKQPAHKVVLATRSLGFLDYFSSSSPPNQINVIDFYRQHCESGDPAVLALLETDPALFDALFEYMYCDSFATEDYLTDLGRATALLDVAQTFGVLGLVDYLEFALTTDYDLSKKDKAGQVFQSKQVPPLRLPDDMRRTMLFASHHSDVTLVVGEGINCCEYVDTVLTLGMDEGPIRYFAHRCVLSARSEHFRALLGGDFLEGRSSEVTLPDIENPLAFAEILRYVYSDKVHLTPENSVHVLILAEEFSLPRLKALAEAYVKDGIDVENAAWLYEIGFRYSASQLREFCLHYMATSRDTEAIKSTEAFLEMPDDSRDDLASNLSSFSLESRTRRPKGSRKKEKGKDCSIQ